MLEHISPTPQNVLAVKAVGKITEEDYRSVLIPAIEDQIAAQGKARFVYVIGPEFDSFALGAMVQDALLGLHHWRDLERLAVVTDRDWIANAMRLIAPLIPAQTRNFDAGQLNEALAWAAA